MSARAFLLMLHQGSNIPSGRMTCEPFVNETGLTGRIMDAMDCDVVGVEYPRSLTTASWLTCNSRVDGNV
jgi:hypothetical protein